MSFVCLGVCCGASCVHFTVLSRKRGVLFFLPEGKNLHIQQLIHHEDLNLCLPLYCYGKVIVELEETQTRNSTGFMVLVIWPNRTLKFLFDFRFNECLWAIFSLVILENFWFLIWFVVVWLLYNFTAQITLPYFLLMPMNKKLQCKDH